MSDNGGYRIYMNTPIDVVWVIFFIIIISTPFKLQIPFNGQSRRRRLKHYNITLYYTLRRLDMLLFVYIILYTYCYYRHCVLWDGIVLNVTRVSLCSDIVRVYLYYYS